MSWSLNEVEGLARKATRGAGASWGMAEEAGKCVRWLMAAGLPGADHLAAVLQRNDGAPYGTLRPQTTTGTWAAEDGPLCPLITGAALCDHATEIMAHRAITLGATSHPVLLLPFAAGVADITQGGIAITWPGTAAILAPGGVIAITESQSIDADTTGSVQIGRIDAAPARPPPARSRAEISSETARILGAFAHRTYAPDTPESRRAGAGAGLTDND